MFGLGTVVLSVVTYALFGVTIRLNWGFSAPIGGVQLAAAVTVLGVFVEVSIPPTRVAGGVGDGVLFAVVLGMWYRLGTGSSMADRAEAASNAVAEWCPRSLDCRRAGR